MNRITYFINLNKGPLAYFCIEFLGIHGKGGLYRRSTKEVRSEGCSVERWDHHFPRITRVIGGESFLIKWEST